MSYFGPPVPAVPSLWQGGSQHDIAWQEGWKAGWNAGTQDEADARKVKSKRLSEIVGYIEALDDTVMKDESCTPEDEKWAERSVRKVFFPNLWDRLSFRIGRTTRKIERMICVGG